MFRHQIRILERYISADDVGLPSANFLRAVANRILDDLPSQPERKRWRVQRHYPALGFSRIDFVDEISEIEKIVEEGPDFNCLSKVVIMYNLGD